MLSFVFGHVKKILPKLRSFHGIRFIHNGNVTDNLKYVNNMSSKLMCVDTKLLNFSVPPTCKIYDPKVYIVPISHKPFIFNDLQLPYIHRIPTIDFPLSGNLNCPTLNNVVEKQAHRMLIIRRKKMNKHKLKKLRKKLKFKIIKIKLKRKMKKEKHFQLTLTQKIKSSADNFIPEKQVYGEMMAYVLDPLPTRFRGKYYPRFIIKQLLRLTPRIDYKGVKSTQDDGF